MDQINRFSTKGPFLIGLIALLVLVGGAGTWATQTEIAGAIIASGQIEVDQNRQVVQHPDGGVVADILVDEGDIVAQGQSLIRLDESELQSQLTITEGQLYELMARRGRLEAERDGQAKISFVPELLKVGQSRPDVQSQIDGQTRLMQARSDSITREIEQMDKQNAQILSQIEGIESQIAALNEQLALIEQELADQKKLLERGLAQASRVLALQREQANIKGRIGELIATKAQANGRITELEIQKLKLGTQRREEAITRLRDLQYRELELAEQRRALKLRLGRLDITAPVSGVVYGLQIFTPRSVIRPADRVMFLVPQDRPLVIMAQVPVIHRDKLYVGQDVTLRFSALDQRQTPELFGKVVLVSADAFQDETTGMSYYRTEIMLNENEASRLPEGTNLAPGMPVEAFIRTEDRTPMAYLIKPFTDYFAKAFRES